MAYRMKPCAGIDARRNFHFGVFVVSVCVGDCSCTYVVKWWYEMCWRSGMNELWVNDKAVSEAAREEAETCALREFVRKWREERGEDAS